MEEYKRYLELSDQIGNIALKFLLDASKSKSNLTIDGDNVYYVNPNGKKYAISGIIVDRNAAPKGMEP